MSVSLCLCLCLCLCVCLPLRLCLRLRLRLRLRLSVSVPMPVSVSVSLCVCVCLLNRAKRCHGPTIARSCTIAAPPPAVSCTHASRAASGGKSLSLSLSLRLSVEAIRILRRLRTRGIRKFLSGSSPYRDMLHVEYEDLNGPRLRTWARLSESRYPGPF